VTWLHRRLRWTVGKLDLTSGSSTFIASRSTSKWLSSVARYCALSTGESKHKEVRYLDIYDDDQFDEAQLCRREGEHKSIV
jgi:hypothetical protein